MSYNENIAPNTGILRGLAKTIQQRRLQMALSQDAVAEKAGLSRTYFSDIERCRRNFSVVTLWNIARALSIPGSHLLQLAEQMATNDEV
jgi:transcriptional regulator with XRE-family HTH domain